MYIKLIKLVFAKEHLKHSVTNMKSLFELDLFYIDSFIHNMTKKWQVSIKYLMGFACEYRILSNIPPPRKKKKPKKTPKQRDLTTGVIAF